MQRFTARAMLSPQQRREHVPRTCLPGYAVKAATHRNADNLVNATYPYCGTGGFEIVNLAPGLTLQSEIAVGLVEAQVVIGSSVTAPTRFVG